MEFEPDPDLEWALDQVGLVVVFREEEKMLKKLVAFLGSPQGKRDVALAGTLVSAVVGVLKQFGIV